LDKKPLQAAILLGFKGFYNPVLRIMRADNRKEFSIYAAYRVIIFGVYQSV
jgi:hypothetical protein